MEGDVLGVRIIPPVLQFFNTVPHTLFKLPVTVLNISTTCKNIRYYGPKSELEFANSGIIDHVPNFSLKVKNPDEAVAPGLAVTATVEYCPMIDKEEKDRIVLTVDGNVIEVPIFAHPCQPLMDMTDIVEFGKIVVNSTTATKEIIITNAGSKKGNFKIKYKGTKQITIVPSSGTIPPHSEERIKVEFVARTAGKLDEGADVHLEGRDAKKLCIKGFVIERALEVLSTSEENTRLDCIRLGNTYYGTDKTDCALLFNNSPEPVSFTAIIDEDSFAQEIGIDLTRTIASALANAGDDVKRGHINDITSLLAAIPNQGSLKPYEKIPIFFRFSPRWYASKRGWKNKVCPPPRKDYAVFLRFQAIGSSNGFLNSIESAEKKATYAEIAITATALPVLLSISPMATLNFGECPVGEHADILCTIKNESNVLPALFEFRNVAHFTAHPPNGKVLPGQAQDVIFTFAPKQIGTFKPEKLLDVIGQVADLMNPQVSYTQIIYTLSIKLLGSSNPITIIPKPKFNPGITPYITNEVGLYVETTFKDLKDDTLRSAVAGSTKTKLHQLKSFSKSAAPKSDGSAKVAFPNDRARSIRPFTVKEKCKTLFTRTDRYHYLDPDYAQDDAGIEKRQKNRVRYSVQLQERRMKRLVLKQIKEYGKTNNNVDIGIKSGAGIFPKKLKQDEIQPRQVSPPPPNSVWKILSTKELARTERMVISKEVCDGLNAVPITAAEKKDCQQWLSPQELHKVIIGPPVINFEKVCVGSICQKVLKIVNNLAQYIHVVAEVDCSELRQSSPLSQVVPPLSKAVIPIIFESTTKELFQRSVMYTVNGFYKHHVTVQAEVVPVAIEVSPGQLFLVPSPGMPAEAGFRGAVTLTNKLNYPAEFMWSPDLGDKGTAFSIRPATGVVDPKTDLDCEVVWHPSFMAPEVGSFTLLITGGESRKLICKAEVGNTNVFFLDQRISFGTAPINLTTMMSSPLHNSGSNHAYFYILDRNPIPGLTVTPTNGVVPVGGSTEIQVTLTPDAVSKFDTRVQVAIRGGRTLELRISGSIESPSINIKVPSFNFGGVYCGSSATIPFLLENKATSKCRFEVDLTRFIDFSVNFPGCQSLEDFNFHLLNPGKASVTLEAEETIEGEISFTPKQVAAYDFVLPVTINYLKPTNSTSFEHSAISSSQTTVAQNPKAKDVTPAVLVPPRQVIATAMRKPLELDTSRLEFLLPSSFHQVIRNFTEGTTKEFCVTNISPADLTLGFDLSLATNYLNKGIFKILVDEKLLQKLKEGIKHIECQLKAGETQNIPVNFCPGDSGFHQIIIPLVINSDWDKPYKFLEICGEMMAPKIVFEPHSIVLIPVPLDIEISTEFTILAYHYTKSTILSASQLSVECDDESKVSPLTVTFLDGCAIKPATKKENTAEPCTLRCKITFCSPKPISFSQPVVFADELGNKYYLQVTATADNCLLTCYSFISLHRASHQIICEQGSLPKGCKVTVKNKFSESEPIKSGEAKLVHCATPHRAGSRCSTSTISLNFQISSSSYESSISLTDSHSSMAESREFLPNKPLESTDFSRYKKIESVALSAGSIIFPEENTEEGVFHNEVLMAVQRWFSYQGWPGGSYPILIPETVRTAICKKTTSDSVKNTEENVSKTHLKANTKSKGMYNRMVKTIYDMVNFLSGKSLPGIPANVSLPANPVDRVKQIYWQHSTLLTFLRCQGGCVSAILPEYLMTPGDFVLWIQLQRAAKMELLQQGNVKDAEKIKVEEEVGEEVFEAISRKMWTDVLLQVLKVLVLVKVTIKSLKNLSNLDKDISMPSVNPNPLSSNIYSIGERVLLAWMNFHYENNRNVIWSDCLKGGVPSSRWIVNFDYDIMDGLVLAALLGSHMPFLIKSHLQGMYTNPITAEQCLHNALKVVSAMRHIGIDYDIHAIDITDPNPISLLLLVVHLFERLPQYLPKTTVDFLGSLHTVVTRQVKVANASAKSLVYHAILAGTDSVDFSIPKGIVVTVPAKSSISLSIDFKSRFLRPAEAVLILVGKRQGAVVGNTLLFNLVTEIDNIKPKATVKVESHCYELKLVKLEVKNPFPEAGEFRIVLIASRISSHESTNSAGTLKDKDKKKAAQSKTTTSKKKQDSQTDVIPMNRIMEHKETMSQKNSQIPSLQAFYIENKTVHLDATESAEITVHFLPFLGGDHQCSVIFLNENIGEFLYSIEAAALEPLPSYLPFIPSKNSVRISAPAGNVAGQPCNDSIIYWRCETGAMLRETLLIPIRNATKERALIIAAQQHMSLTELQRRQITGTLMSCSVMAKAIKELSNNPVAAVSLAKAVGPVIDVYRVQVDSEYFSVPDMLVMPNTHNENKCKPQGPAIPVDANVPEGVAELVVQFKAKEPGQYPATITLTAIDDMRIYRIECAVTPPSSSPEMEFITPVFQSVTQNIPITNWTDSNWTLDASISGTGFHGPSSLKVKAGKTTKYPLTFAPTAVEEIAGKLVLTNKIDGAEQTFELVGKSEKPLALDQIQLICAAKASLIHVVKVPNVTSKKQTFRVESDLPFITGEQTITVLPHHTGSYNAVFTPNRRGMFKGILAFFSDRSPIQELDSDGEAYQPSTDPECHGNNLWYSLEVNVKPSPPEKTVTVFCACRKKTLVEVIVRNPTPREITLKASIIGFELTGPLSITLSPGTKDVYTLTFAPTRIGETWGSLIFFNEEVGEFWYNLILIAEPPTPTTLPPVKCELGSWTRNVIELDNPLEESLEVTAAVSNANNFILEADLEKPIVLRPNAVTNIGLRFRPSYLGEGDHKAKITFTSERIGDWIFYASGIGLLPSPQLPVVTNATVGSNTTFFIIFRNSTDLPVLADIYLTDKETDSSTVFTNVPAIQSPFKLLLKCSSGIHIDQKSFLQIPLSFTPSETNKYRAFCTVVTRREDGQKWPLPSGEQQSSSTTRLNEIRWLFPIEGISDSAAVKDPAQITGNVNDRVEKKLEVSLTSESTKASSMKGKFKVQKNKKNQMQEDDVENHANSADEYSFEVFYANDEVKELIEKSLDVTLAEQFKSPSTGEVTLVFYIKFAPVKSFDHQVELHVTSATEGFWIFPLRLTAVEPPADDNLVIEASGLGKPSMVAFRLNSQQDQPAGFSAFFENGSDPEFSVTPEMGELASNSTIGTQLTVTFLPNVYGKLYSAKLVVKTASMQWSLSIRGVLPEYQPPRGVSAHPIAGPHPPIKLLSNKKNYIRENLKLLVTAVSSPIKGAHLVPIGQAQN